MRGWTIHLSVYLAVNGFLVFFWLLTTGTVDELQTVIGNPSEARDLGFWPIWPIAVWGVGLAIHTGVLVADGAFGFQARRRRRRRRRELQRAWDKTARWAGNLATAKLQARLQSEASEESKEPHPPSGTRHWVAVMFTDIADSTPLTETMGDDAWREVLTRHRSTVRECVDGCGGQEVSTQGDSFFVRFDSVPDAVECAVALQRRLASDRQSDDTVPETRIGMHAGEVLQDDGGDLLGHVVNLASRVTGTAVGGEILVTESMADLCPAGIELVDRGLETLKGVSQPRHLLAVKWD